jgi:hypothetical protein
MGRCGDNVTVDLEVVECEVVDWIKLILDMTE